MSILNTTPEQLNDEAIEYIEWCEKMYAASKPYISLPPKLKYRDTGVDSPIHPRGKYEPIIVYYSVVFSVTDSDGKLVIYQQLYSKYFSDDNSILAITSPEGFVDFVKTYIRGVRDELAQPKDIMVHAYQQDIFHMRKDVDELIRLNLDYHSIMRIEILTSDQAPVDDIGQ